MIAADRACALASDGVGKVRDPKLLPGFLGIKKDRCDEAEISAGRVAYGVEGGITFLAQERNRIENIGKNTLKVGSREEPVIHVGDRDAGS